MRKSEIAALAIVLVSFLTGVYLYSRMPENMASHWNISGDVNGYIPKFWGLFLMPALSFVLFLFFLVIPKIDPLKQNIAKFRKYFDGFVVLVILFLFYIDLLTISWNLGFRFNIIQVLIPALSVLIYYSGVVIENSKRNWFIGIRTPWTMSSDEVWKKTSERGGKLFRIAAIISLVGILFESYAMYIFLFPLIAVVIYTVVYSYFEYRKHKK